MPSKHNPGRCSARLNTFTQQKAKKMKATKEDPHIDAKLTVQTPGFHLHTAGRQRGNVNVKLSAEILDKAWIIFLFLNIFGAFYAFICFDSVRVTGNGETDRGGMTCKKGTLMEVNQGCLQWGEA